MKKALVEGVYLIKPNVREFRELVEKESAKKQLPSHPFILERLHQEVWALPDGDLTREWGVTD